MYSRLEQLDSPYVLLPALIVYDPHMKVQSTLFPFAYYLFAKLSQDIRRNSFKDSQALIKLTLDTVKANRPVVWNFLNFFC